MMKNIILRGFWSVAFLSALAIPGFATQISLPTNVGCAGSGPVLCNIDDKMTYLLAAGPFNGTTFGADGISPQVIDLQTVGGFGLQTGDVIRLTALGDMCFNNGSSCQSPTFGAVFSSSALFESNNVTTNRVINALSAPGGTTGVVSPTTVNGGFNTDISQDFLVYQISGTVITLPNINQYRYLFIGIVDSYYGDNSDLDNNLQVQLAVVPEPATYGLLLSGLGALFAFRRFRKN